MTEVSMWFLVALTGNIILSVVSITDKFILSKSVPKPIVFVFYSTIFVLPLFFLLPFGASLPTVWVDHLVFALSGICFSLGLWTMYIGFQESEISHVGPLVGAATPFFVFLVSGIFLRETLTTANLVAIFFLIFGSLIISFEKSPQHNGWHRGMAWGILAGLLFGISHVAAKYAYNIYGFYNGFVWTKVWIGIFGIALLALSPAVREIFRKKQKSSVKKSGQSVLIFMNKILGVAGVVIIQYAIALGSVSLVNALAGVQYALLVILVAALSKFWPKLIRESYSKKEIIQEVVAVLIIGYGLVLMVK